MCVKLFSNLTLTFFLIYHVSGCCPILLPLWAIKSALHLHLFSRYEKGYLKKATKNALRWHGTGGTIVIVLRCGEITQKIMLLVYLPLVYLINKCLYFFNQLCTWCHTKLIPEVILNFNHNVIKGKVFPLHSMEGYRGSRGIVPLILNLGRRWRWVVNFITWLLNHGGKMVVALE